MIILDTFINCLNLSVSKINTEKIKSLEKAINDTSISLCKMKYDDSRTKGKSYLPRCFNCRVKTSSCEMKKKISTQTVVKAGNMLFYFCAFAMIVGIIAFLCFGNASKSILGFNLLTVQTNSMEPIYPVGSLIVTRITSPEAIQIGDDITVLTSSQDNHELFLTHRVIDIGNTRTGARLFYTQGVNSQVADRTPFSEDLLIGKVMFCLPYVGYGIDFLNKNLLGVVLLVVFALALYFCVKIKRKR